MQVQECLGRSHLNLAAATGRAALASAWDVDHGSIRDATPQKQMMSLAFDFDSVCLRRCCRKGGFISASRGRLAHNVIRQHGGRKPPSGNNPFRLTAPFTATYFLCFPYILTS